MAPPFARGVTDLTAERSTAPTPAAARPGPGGPSPDEPPRKGTPAPVTSRFALNTLAVFSVAVLGQFLGWVATHELFVHVAPGASSGTGLEMLGYATFYMTISSIVYTLGDLRFVTAYQFFVARGGDVGSLTTAYLVFRFVSMGGLAVGFILLIPVFAPGQVLSGGFPLDLFLILPLIETPSFVYSYMMAARGKAGAGQWPLVLENCIRTPLLVLVAIIYTYAGSPSVGSKISLLGLHFTVQQVGPSIVTSMAWAYILGASVPFVAIIVHSVISPNGLYRHLSLGAVGPELKTMAIFSWPLVGAMFLTYAVSVIPPLFVVAFLGEASVQSFSSANAFLLLLMFLPNAITIPLFPDMASLFVRGENKLLRSRTRKSMRWTVMILAPAILAVIVFRKVLLNDLYSSAITVGANDAEYALVLLAISVIPQSLFRIMGSVLDAAGQRKRELYLSALQLTVLSASLVAFLYPTSPLRALGVTGAALAVLLSTTAGFLGNAWYLHRYVRVHPQVRPYATIVLAAIVTFSLFSVSVSHFLGGLFGDPTLALPVSNVVVLFLTVVAGVAIYLIVLAAVGELTKEDVLEMGGSLGVPAVLPRALARICWRGSWPDEDEEDTPLPLDPKHGAGAA